MTQPFSQTLCQLKVNDVATALHSTIENLSEEWQHLDSQYLLPGKKSKSSRGYLAIPENSNYLNLDINMDSIDHERVSNENKIEYFQKLYSLFRRIPKESTLRDEISNCSLEIGNYLKEKSLISKDMASLPELESSITTSLTTLNANSLNEFPNKKVYTFHVHCAESGSLHQIIQLFNDHSLMDLKKAIYCVRNELPPSTATASEQSQEEFFCIDKILYTNTPHSSVSSTSTSPLLDLHHWLTTQRLPPLSHFHSVSDQVIAPAIVPLTVTASSSSTSASAAAVKTKPNKRKSPADSAALAASLLQHIQALPLPVLLAQNITSMEVTSSTSNKHAKKSRKDPPQLPPQPSITPTPTATSHPNPSNYPQTLIKDMESTSLDHCCSLRCGEQLLFGHAGYCEHILTLTDIHPYHPAVDGGDSSSRSKNYPKEQYRALGKVRKCFVCDVLSADYIVLEDRLAEVNPCLYCRECFNMSHYDKRGQLLYDDFVVYHYLHDT